MDFVDVYASLILIKDMKDDWDGYGAEPITETVVDNAFKIIKYLEGLGNRYEFPVPFIAPSSDGQIQFEWDLSNGKALEIHVLPNGKISFLKYYPDDNYSMSFINKHNEIEKLIKWLMEG